MPQIDQPNAVRFSNERIRVAADILCRGVAAAKAILAEWQAKSMATQFPDDATYIVADGSPADGRQQITGADANRAIEALQTLVGALESASSNGKTHYENALRVAVNPTPRMSVEL